MIKSILTVLLLHGITVEAMAASESGIIYIRKDGIHTIADVIMKIVPYLWKDIISFAVAAVAAITMIFLAVKLKNNHNLSKKS